LFPSNARKKKLQNDLLDVEKIAATAENEAFGVTESRLSLGFTVALLHSALFRKAYVFCALLNKFMGEYCTL